MKLVVAIIQEEDTKKVVEILINEGFKITKLRSTGGFLELHNTITLSAIEDKFLDHYLSIIKQNCKSRQRFIENLPLNILEGNPGYSLPVKITVGGAQVFVINLEDYKKF
ncbi:MAG: cyclic-di-AMP receptor [Caldisericia bacterium]|nr:cyclic-di-AMP receptor [Caldisericia bacterium]